MQNSTASRIATEATRQGVAATDPRFAEWVSMQYRSISGGMRSNRTYGEPQDASADLVAKVRAELADIADAEVVQRIAVTDIAPGDVVMKGWHNGQPSKERVREVHDLSTHAMTPGGVRITFTSGMEWHVGEGESVLVVRKP